MILAWQYVMPGIIDMHGHIGGAEQGTPTEYAYKLWMGHCITTIRDPSYGNGQNFA
jgi:imidazolonepropionase-like amidohydrolase